MKINSDYRDLLHALNEENVRYLIVGVYAWMAHTEPRYTKDLDVWIEPVRDNAVSLLQALARWARTAVPAPVLSWQDVQRIVAGEGSGVPVTVCGKPGQRARPDYAGRPVGAKLGGRSGT